MCSIFFKFFTVTGINNIMYSKYRIGNTKLNTKLPIVIFQINSISLNESENLGKPRLPLVHHLDLLRFIITVDYVPKQRHMSNLHKKHKMFYMI